MFSIGRTNSVCCLWIDTQGGSSLLLVLCSKCVILKLKGHFKVHGSPHTLLADDDLGDVSLRRNWCFLQLAQRERPWSTGRTRSVCPTWLSAARVTCRGGPGPVPLHPLHSRLLRNDYLMTLQPSGSLQMELTENWWWLSCHPWLRTVPSPWKTLKLHRRAQLAVDCFSPSVWSEAIAGPSILQPSDSTAGRACSGPHTPHTPPRQYRYYQAARQLNYLPKPPVGLLIPPCSSCVIPLLLKFFICSCFKLFLFLFSSLI